MDNRVLNELNRLRESGDYTDSEIIDIFVSAQAWTAVIMLIMTFAAAILLTLFVVWWVGLLVGFFLAYCLHSMIENSNKSRLEFERSSK